MPTVITLLIALLVNIEIFASAVSKRLDGDVQTEIIEKLENATEIAGANSTIKRRLADLYAERARITENQKLAQENQLTTSLPTCESCGDAKKDRSKSLRLYEGILDDKKMTVDSERNQIKFQMAHLHVLNGEEKKAEVLYRQMLKALPQQAAQAHVKLAEIEQSRLKFKTAQSHLQKALNLDKSVDIKRGQRLLQLAWIDYNLGDTRRASNTTRQILINKNLMSQKDASGQWIIDKAFQSDVSKDHSEFLAKISPTPYQIKELVELSPDDQRQQNMSSLADELDRLGNHKASLFAWTISQQLSGSSTDQLVAILRTAKAHYDLGNKKNTLLEIQKYVQVHLEDPAKSEKTDHHGLKQLITQWDKASSKQPDASLVEAYMAYLKAFPDDTKMTHWAARAAKKTSDHERAAALFGRASSLAKNETQAGTDWESFLEETLVGQIESAQKTNRSPLLRKALEDYLSHLPQGRRAPEIRYQLVYMDYENHEWQKAFEGFTELTKQNDLPRELKVKSADLALDCLNTLKDPKLLTQWARTFASQFLQRREEYLKISRQATIKFVSGHSQNSSDLRDGIHLLNLANQDFMPQNERSDWIRAKITLSRQLKDINLVESFSLELKQSAKPLSPDENFALENLLWVYESKLDFSKAFQISKKLSASKHASLTWRLRLAIYADLAGIDPTPYYKQYLQKTGHKDLEIVAKLIEASHNPGQELRRYERRLKKNPQLYSRLVLIDFSRSKDFALATKRLSGVANHPSGRIALSLVRRHKELKEYSRTPLIFHQLTLSTESKQSASVIKRLALLKETEKKANSKDWMIQTLYLDLLRKEYSRAFHDVRSLPLPRRLSPSEKKQYSSVLFSKSQSLELKGQEANKLFHEAWNKDTYVTSLLEEIQTTKGPLRKLLLSELKILAALAPDSKLRTKLYSHVEVRDDHQIRAELKSAEHKVKTNPFDIDSLEKLLAIERRFGRPAMVAFLEARTQTLRRGIP